MILYSEDAKRNPTEFDIHLTPRTKTGTEFLIHAFIMKVSFPVKIGNANSPQLLIMSKY
jgi:hypothetical protein